MHVFNKNEKQLIASNWYFHTFHFVSDPQSPVAKTVRNLLNLIARNTVTVEFSNASMGMYLIPVILSSTVSNIITALQFNNII